MFARLASDDLVWRAAASDDPGMRRREMDRIECSVAELRLPDVVFKTCPWQPRELIETGLRQWLRCCGAALRHRQVIGMPSHAVDEAWHGLILCTAAYSDFCQRAYGRYLHHHPEGAEAFSTPGTCPGAHSSMAEQLGRTVIAWSIVAGAGEECVLWDLDSRVGVESPWGIAGSRVRDVSEAANSVLSLSTRERRA